MQNLQVRHAKFASLDMQNLHPSLPDIVNLMELKTLSDFFELQRETTGVNCRTRRNDTRNTPGSPDMPSRMPRKAPSFDCRYK